MEHLDLKYPCHIESHCDLPSEMPTLSSKIQIKTQNYTETLEVLMPSFHFIPHFICYHAKPFLSDLYFSDFLSDSPLLKANHVLCYMRGELYGELSWMSRTPPSAMPFFFWKINHVSSNKMVTLMLPILLTPWPGLCKCKCRLWMHVQCLIFLGRILYNWNLSSPGDESKTNLRIKSHRGIIPKGNLLSLLWLYYDVRLSTAEAVWIPFQWGIIFSLTAYSTL